MNQLKFYNKIAQWITNNKLVDETLIVGINGPQGIGKTTLTRSLIETLSTQGLKVVNVSIDDFYLTGYQQEQLATNCSNPYLKWRGYPGTHDITLGLQVLSDLQQGLPTKVPRYDKTARAGRGDRLAEKHWQSIKGKQDVVLFEGWMLGFTPVENLKNKYLEEINLLLQPYSKWLSLIDIFLNLRPIENTYVLQWRIDAERKQRSSGLGAMSEQEVLEYINSFLPAYEAFADTVQHNKNKTRDYLEFLIGKDRLPVNQS